MVEICGCRVHLTALPLRVSDDGRIGVEVYVAHSLHVPFYTRPFSVHPRHEPTTTVRDDEVAGGALEF